MGIRPREDDYVIGLALVTDDCTLLVASENGLGKRTPFGDYRKQSRGGKGIITMKVTDKTGPVVGAVTVTDADELMLMTSTGQSIRIRVSEIRETGRNAQGVKLLTLKTGEKLQDVSLVIPDGEDSDAALTSADDSESPDIDATLASADESETPDMESPEDTDAV
jgi:DNA gyrase subunit A